MKVAVIGAGVIGVTTAWELAADGLEVTVFERRGAVAAEASFANAGVVGPNHVTPCSAPGVPTKVVRHLLRRHTSVRVLAGLSAGDLAWMWRWFRACRLGTYPTNGLRMQRLAYFSRERLHRLTRDLKLDYERSEGCLVLLRTAKAHAIAQTGLEALNQSNPHFEMPDTAQCRAVERGLSDETALHSGVYLPDAGVGNCRQFPTLLRTQAQRVGVRFRLHTKVQEIRPGHSPRLVHVYAPPEEPTVLTNVSADVDAASALSREQDTQPLAMHPITEGFDAVLFCAALASDALLRLHGLKLPMQPVYGYSITAPLRRHESHPDIGRRSALLDGRYNVAISRLGSRVRGASGVEIGGAPGLHNLKTSDTLYKVLHDWFPRSARLSQTLVRKGARPTLPDGPPVLGRSGIEGVWLNLGHGSSGWAHTCGSARVLADSVAGRAPAIDIAGLGVERLRS